MLHMFVRNRVADFSKWKRIFHSHAQAHSEAGLRLIHLWQSPPRFDILLVLALGKPKERVMIERVDASGNTKYWRDNEGVHHVPKRSLEDIIIG